MPNIKKMTDEELVLFIIKKDKEAFGEIIKRYQKKLLRYSTYLVRNEDRAADVVQDSFIKAFKNLNGFNKKLKFSSWIYRIVHNESLNLIKKYKKEVPISKNFDFDSGIDIEKEYEKKEVVKMTRNCLSNLPDLYREPLSLFYLEDKTYMEISDILRIPVSTVGTRVKRAKVIMKKICKTKKI